MLKQLGWESDFFQMNCAEVPEGTSQALDIRMFERFDWVQARRGVDDTKSIRSLEKAGFFLEDLRITFSKMLSHNCDTSKNDTFQASRSDIEAVRQISKSAFVEYSRFVSLVGAAKTANFYEAWAENAILGTHDDLCRVIKIDEECVGFVTLKCFKDGKSRIGLIGVVDRYKNRGIGKKLIASIENSALDLGCQEVAVVTEGKNIPAQRFYIRNGYNIDCIEYWHYWRHP